MEEYRHTALKNMNPTAQLLLECEQNGLAPAFDNTFDAVVECDTSCDEVIVISDLHIAAGLDKDRNFTGTENFYADAALQRFLSTTASEHQGKKKLLVINGDFLDFLRIAAIPETNTEFAAWLDALQSVGISAPNTIAALQASISTEQKQGYGLKTNEFKSVWKVLVASAGHSIVFDALASWLANGNELIITKGNHDLEWYWPGVRNILRLTLAERIHASSGKAVDDVLHEILPRIRFINNAVVLNKELYIEHGQRYDNFTKVVPENEQTYHGEELNIPFGSFFNRYLLNRIELRYPFYENIRPRTSILPVLIKQDFPLAVRVFFRYIPFLGRTFMKKRYWAMILQTFSLVFTIAIPLVIFLVVVFIQFKSEIVRFINGQIAPVAAPTDIIAYLKEKAITLLKDGGILVLSYLLSRLVAMLQISEPDSLLPAADRIDHLMQTRFPDLRIITMGHTHDPEQRKLASGRWYYNTGTWIPVIEASSTAIREDRTYVVLRVPNLNGHFDPRSLRRWNDDAMREDELVLVVAGDQVAASVVHPNMIQRLSKRARWFFASK